MHRIRLIGGLHTFFLSWQSAMKKRALERVLQFGGYAVFGLTYRVGTKLAANANTELGTFILTG